MESVSSLASLESEVKHLDEASESVVEATASGRIIARHMLDRRGQLPVADASECLQELLEILPDQCSDAKAQNRLTRMLDFGKSDYQVQVNELANKCKDLQSSQKQARCMSSSSLRTQGQEDHGENQPECREVVCGES
ncbi:unnamed protein product [Prorocentrum cordatum]|uniref:Uncharacterized protein n=1 Tax=Prorocentrum cordatum TaxID=2364126 RepID=A0ABN9TLR9_9DINO|nr:unnamed protein product [Polarella glacialis]